MGIRWTVGDVSDRGLDALALSIRGAVRLFGSGAAYAVVVNTISAETARARAGLDDHPAVQWLPAAGLPGFLATHLDAGLAEGVAWKLSPLRLFPDCHELSLDNDCVLWAMPDAVRRWLDDPAGCLLAADAASALGRFAPVLGPRALNTGIRGLPPGFDLEAALAAVLSEHPGPLLSELDEQGLQVAALVRERLHVIPVADVAICSPFPPHASAPGRCGAHFVGLNVHRERPYCDAATMARIAAFWDAHRPSIEAELPPP